MLNAQQADTNNVGMLSNDSAEIRRGNGRKMSRFDVCRFFGVTLQRLA